jgi:molybdenum cofactor synthesis domain-containing protein
VEQTKQTGTIASLNISEKKGECKKPVDHITIQNTGLAGDAHAGDWNRQVSLLSSESIERFSQDHNLDVAYGSFAENITTRNLDLNRVRLMDTFTVNGASLLVTQIGKACHGDGCAIYTNVGKCVMPKEGIFCRVLSEGSANTGDPLHWKQRTLNIGILTVSDRASRGEYTDRGGPKVQTIIQDFFKDKLWNLHFHADMLPDDADRVRNWIIDSTTTQNLSVLFTTGGTGVGPRDITPDAVQRLPVKVMPGIMELIRTKYGRENPNALLSRSIAAVYGATAIYTLPGSEKAIEEYLTEIVKTLEHTVYMLNGLDTH